MNCPFCNYLLRGELGSYTCTKTHCNFYYMATTTTDKINFLEYHFYDQNKKFDCKLLFKKDKAIDTFLILEIKLNWMYDEITKDYEFKIEQFGLEEIKETIQNCKDQVYKIIENRNLE